MKISGGIIMSKITNIMIREFRINELGYDFMGYSLKKPDIYTYHHLLIPNCNKGPASFWNGAILCGNTSHPYLHTIEDVDYDIFSYITSEMLDMKIKEAIDIENVRKINDLLCYFEKEHSGDRAKGGKPLIKEAYTKRFLNHDF